MRLLRSSPGSQLHSAGPSQNFPFSRATVLTRLNQGSLRPPCRGYMPVSFGLAE